MLPVYAIYAIGFAAQACFSARILVQWILSERARRVLSPSAFWVCSLVGSYLLCIYGYLRGDFSIVLGQFISYYVYIGNLRLKGLFHRLPFWIRLILWFTPMVALALVTADAGSAFERFFRNEQVPMWLLLFGSAGQIVFTLRFLYQWFYSVRRNQSLLPAGFWIISLCGSLIIVAYGMLRSDPVLIIGQSFGLIAYIRNLFIGRTKTLPS